MEAGNVSDALELIMRARGWSQAELAAELGVRQNWVSRVVRGERDPGIGRISAMLDRVGWTVRICPTGEEPDRVKRREFQGKIIKVGAGTAAGTIAQKVGGVRFVPPHMDDAYRDPEYIEGLAHRAARAHWEWGGAPVQPVLRQVRRVQARLSEGGKGQYSAASELCRRAGWILHDADDLGEAQQLAKKSAYFAHRAEDAEKEANAYALLSGLSSSQDRAEQGAYWAQKGLQLHDVPDELRATLYVRLGRALSRISGYEGQVRGAIERGLTIEMRSPLDIADIRGVAGVALQHTGERGQALAYFTEAIRLGGSKSPLLHAVYLARSGMLALNARDLALAAAVMHDLCDIAPLLSSQRVRKYLDDVFRASTPWRTVPIIKAARDELRETVSVL